ncbi:hypothetical protein [Pedobacter sp. JCM 36344]|uniref:hypothetical protein n=1 Tax=Pedobacter sp. JCM 36344 TaxID=3374280 RepID=UPI00397DEFC2
MDKTIEIGPEASFTDKVMFGLKIALRKMTEEAALRDDSLVIGKKDGTFELVPAKELLKTLPE